ncbi:MAG: hypothetical protein V1659_03570 [Candidatus Woesearchaeota archaeon]
MAEKEEKKEEKKTKESEKADSRETLLEEAKRKTEYLARKASISEIEVYELVKFFFKRFLKKEHELTCEELADELNNIYIEDELKTDFYKFLDQINLMEYSNKGFSQDELKLLVKEFDNLIERTFSKIKKKKKRRFTDIFKKKKVEKQFSLLEDQLKKLEAEQKQKAAHTPEERMHIMIDRVKLLLEQGSLGLARTAYKELMIEYELSHKDIQKIFYKEISQLFAELNAEHKSQ